MNMDAPSKFFPLLFVLMLGSISTVRGEVPYTGVVVPERVVIRAGAGGSFYPVGELERGALVEVDEVMFGWFRIEPPPGVYSYVSKERVELDDSGQEARVIRDRTPVMAAHVEGPGDSYRRQVNVNRGDVLEVVGEAGAYYRVLPPPGASVFVEPGAIRKAGKEEIAAASEPVSGGGEMESGPKEPAAGEAPGDAGDEEGVEASGEAGAGGARGPEGAVAPETRSPARSGEEGAGSPEGGDEKNGGQAPDPAGASEAALEDPEAAGPLVQAPPRAPGQTEPEEEAGEGESQAAAAGEADDAGPEEEGAGSAEPGVEPDAGDPRENGSVAGGERADSGGGASGAPGDPEHAERPAGDALTRDFEEAEARFEASREQPIEARDHGALLEAYRALEGAPLSRLQSRVVLRRIAELEREEAVVRTLRELGALREEIERDGVRVSASDRELARRYDAVGRLVASRVYDGDRLPRLFRLVDPAHERTVAYLAPARTWDPAVALGRVVGVVGSKRRDPDLRINVLEVDRLDLLRPETSDP